MTLAAEKGSAALCDMLIQAAARSTRAGAEEAPSFSLEDPATLRLKRRPPLEGKKSACGMEM